MSSQDIELSIVVPVFGAGSTLPELVERILVATEVMQKRFELILVDDSGHSSAWEVISGLVSRHPGIVTGVQLMRNYGQHNALMCGFRHAQGQIIITLDDDLQNTPEDIPQLLSTMEAQGCDVVYAIPALRQDSLWRRMGSAPIQWFIQSAIGLPGPVSAFRAIRKQIVDAILRYDLNYTFIDGLLSWATDRFGYIEVNHQPRIIGRSGYSLWKLIFHAVNIVTNFSLLPLQLASVTGLIASFCGVLFGVYFLLQSLLNNNRVPGYASIVVAVMTLGGLQLLAIGIIGEYIGRLHLNVNRKPQYTVRQVLRAGNAPEMGHCGPNVSNPERPPPP